MYIYNLKELKSLSKELVGGKAYGLGRLSTIDNINIANCICLTVKCFEKFLNDLELNATITNLISEIHHNKILCRKNLAKIREIILSQKILQPLLDDIIANLISAKINLEDGVSVRSSSVNEDNDSKTYAGIFVSTLNVKNVEELEQAILKTWASSFSEVAYYYNGLQSINKSMAIIIQTMIYGELNGVLFSVSPDNYDYMQLEGSKNIGDIVEGNNPDLSLKILRKEKLLTKYNNIDFNELRDIALKIEAIWNSLVDIEWSYFNHKFYIMQCRPISTHKKIDTFTVIDQDDINTCSTVNLGCCREMFNRFLGKQAIFRENVVKNGFSVYKHVYILYKKHELTKSDLELIKKHIKSNNLIVEYDKSRMFCTMDNLYDVIIKEENNYNDNILCFRIGEIIRADLSGYSSITKDGNIYVEYVPGRMHGLISGKIAPVQVVIGKDIKYISRQFMTHIETVDIDTGKRIQEPYGKQPNILSEREIEQIRNYTLSLTKTFGQARLEWFIYQGKLYGKDISMEENNLNITENTATVISLGSAKGIAFFLNDLDALDEIAGKYNISLVSHSKSEEMVKYDKKLLNIIEQITAHTFDIIIFAERPSLGILAISDYIKGFVFRQCSILSHVGITLREKHIPAIISPEAFENIIDDDEVLLTPNGVTSFKKGEISNDSTKYN